MAATEPRQVAFAILKRVELAGASASVLLRSMAEDHLDSRDAALATELVNGVLRRRLFLDAVISAFSSRPLERIDTDVRLILELATYQLLFLDRIPAHAAVHEAVEMVRGRVARRGAEGFVNGLLRAVAKNPAAARRAPLDGRHGDEAESLAMKESHPLWITRRWIDRLGVDETRALLAAQNTPPAMAVRANSRLCSASTLAAALLAEGVATRPSGWLEEFLIVEEGVAQRTDTFRRGWFYVQDLASGLVARLAWSGLGEGALIVLDACAAPGGKALAAADLLGDRSFVVACDLHPARLRVLAENSRRMALPWCASLAVDLASGSPPFCRDAGFDAVLVDAPCSGTGVIRRHPELRYRMNHEYLARLAELQRSLLRNCARLVRPGGALTYSVCSLEPEEGILQAQRFLEEQRDFVPADPRPFLPDEAAPLVTRSPAGDVLVTQPHRDDLDGFFAARFARQR